MRRIRKISHQLALSFILVILFIVTIWMVGIVSIKMVSEGTEYCINKQIDKVRNLRINELKEMGEIQPDIKPDNDNPKL